MFSFLVIAAWDQNLPHLFNFYWHIDKQKAHFFNLKTKKEK